MATRNAEVEALKAVLERVKFAAGPDRRLDYELFVAFANPEAPNIWDPCEGHFYTASIDAAAELMGRVLPGWDFHFYPQDGGYVAEMDWPKDAQVGDAGYFGITGRGATRSLAIMSGILEGVLALTQESAHEHG